MPDREDLFALVDALRASASAGARFTGDPLDRDRYRGLLALAARLEAALDAVPAERVAARYEDALERVTPWLATDAAVFRDDRLLLLQRHDSGEWALPGGLAEVGELPAASAARELREEVRLEGEPRRLLAMFDSRVWRSAQRRHLVHLVFETTVAGGEPRPTPEARAVGFFPLDALPPLHAGHRHWVPLLFALHRSGGVHVDLPGRRSPHAPGAALP